VDVDGLAADLMSVAEEEQVDLLAGHEGRHGAGHRDAAQDRRLAALQMSDLEAYVGGGRRGACGSRRGQGSDEQRKENGRAATHEGQHFA